MSKIKHTLKKIWYKMPIKIFMKNTILMESGPDYADNTKYVFDEIIRRGLNKKYKVIWAVKNKDDFSDVNIPNVKFMSRHAGKLERIKYIFTFLFAKYIIDCNEYVQKTNKNQFRIHLTHGEPLKVPLEYFNGVGEVDHFVATSDYFRDIYIDTFKANPKKLVVTGFPRNDAFFNNEKPVYIFPEIERVKTILWMPTYRNHKELKDNPSFNLNINFRFGVPCINNEDELDKLNELLKANNILLVLKLHPAEDTSKIKNSELSNIKLFDNNVFKKDHTNIYNVLPLVDALITDYSSVYYDYLFCDRPIGLTIADLKEYSKSVKMITDDYKSVIKGEYIENFEDLYKFFENVINSKDESKDSRIEAKKIFHKYIDGKSSARIVDLLEEKMKRKKK